jgi:hypothetical protein
MPPDSAAFPAGLLPVAPPSPGSGPPAPPHDRAGACFQTLDAEIALWRAAGLTLPIWIRDDDATEPSAALDALIARAEAAGVPLALAVIPAGATAALAARVARAPGLRVLVHGWAHANHEPPGARKAEFGAARPPAEALADAARGLARLSDLFGDRVLPVFVPPWNRIAPAVAAGLRGAGFAALSSVPRAARGVTGLVRCDATLDPIDWRGTRSLHDPAALAAAAAAALAARRAAGGAPAPFVVLTHHRVHDAAIDSFVAALLARLAPIATPFDLATLAAAEAAP